MEEEKEGNSEGNTESNIEGNTEGNAEGKTEGNAEGNTSTSAMRDYVSDGSSSLSPPVLVPLQDVNSDFEETIEDPPDLELYEINRGTFLNFRSRRYFIDLFNVSYRL